MNYSFNNCMSYFTVLEKNTGRTICGEEQKEDGKRGIHRETEAKLLNAKHTDRRKCLVLTLCSTETGSGTIITHSMLTELHIYTSLASCLLPSLTFTKISLYISEGI